MKGTNSGREPGARPADNFLPKEMVFITHWIDLGRGMCVQLKLDDRGWGWHAWAQGSTEGWRALPAPAPADIERRFITEAQAVRFFELLAQDTRHSA